jgi:hypothetical protein
VNWLSTVLSSICLLLFCASTVVAQPPQVLQGQPAPLDGLLFSLDYIQQTLDLLYEGENLKSQNESLKAEISVLKEQITLLKAAVQNYAAADKNREEALIRADEREKLRAEMDEKFKLALLANKEAFDNLIRSNQQAQAGLTQAQKHIQELEKQKMLSNIFGPLSLIIGIAIGVFTAGAFF